MTSTALAAAYEQPEEQTLIVDARAGSVLAFERLVERYHPGVLRYLTVQTGDAELAADLAQETFLDAYRSLDRLPTEYSFAAWLYRIARNNLLPEWRRRRVRQLISLDALRARFGQGQLAESSPAATEALHERDVILQALERLSPALREALLLHSQWGFPGREVAAILGISHDAARRRISRAREQFIAEYRLLEGDTRDANV